MSLRVTLSTEFFSYCCFRRHFFQCKRTALWKYMKISLVFFDNFPFLWRHIDTCEHFLIFHNSITYFFLPFLIVVTSEEVKSACICVLCLFLFSKIQKAVLIITYVKQYQVYCTAKISEITFKVSTYNEYRTVYMYVYAKAICRATLYVIRDFRCSIW